MISSGYWSQCRQSEDTHTHIHTCGHLLVCFFFHRIQTNPNPVTFSNGLFSIWPPQHTWHSFHLVHGLALWQVVTVASFKLISKFKLYSWNNSFPSILGIKHHFLEHSHAKHACKRKRKKVKSQKLSAAHFQYLLIALQRGSHSLQKAAGFSSLQWSSHLSWLRTHAGVSSLRLCVSFNKDAAL